MQIKTKSGRILKMPDAEEDAAITAAAMGDDDALPLTDEQLAQMKPARPRGRPAGSGKKVLVSVRFDTDVIEAFRQTGDGWQTRMNDALKDWLKTHPAQR